MSGLEDEIEPDEAAPDEAPAEPVKRRPGRAKGSPKVPGSGRKRGTPSLTLEERKEAEALIYRRKKHVALGGNIWQIGPTGKKYLAPAPAHVQSREGDTVLAKELADQRATSTLTINGKIEADVRHQPEPDSRSIARAVFDILRQAHIEAEPGELGPALDPLGRLAATDVEYTDPMRRAPAGTVAAPMAPAGDGRRRGPAGALPWPGPPDDDLGPIREGDSVVESVAPDDPLWQRTAVSPSAYHLHQPQQGEQPPPGMGVPVVVKGPKPGDTIKLPGVKGHLEILLVMNDNVARYWVVDDYGQRLCAINGREPAEGALREWSETGKIDVPRWKRA